MLNWLKLLKLQRRRNVGALIIFMVGFFFITSHFWEKGAFTSELRTTSMAEGELKVAQRQAEVCSSRNATGIGLTGEYFSDIGFKGVVMFSRIDSTIEFDSSFDIPPRTGSRKPQSIRWRGWVRPPISGKYFFHTGMDHAIVSVAARILTDVNEKKGKDIELAAGRYYPIVVEIENTNLLSSSEQLRLEWTVPSGSRYVIPRALLFLPSETVSK